MMKINRKDYAEKLACTDIAIKCTNGVLWYSKFMLLRENGKYFEPLLAGNFAPVDSISFDYTTRVVANFLYSIDNKDTLINATDTHYDKVAPKLLSLCDMVGIGFSNYYPRQGVNIKYLYKIYLHCQHIVGLKLTDLKTLAVAGYRLPDIVDYIHDKNLVTREKLGIYYAIIKRAQAHEQLNYDVVMDTLKNIQAALNGYDKNILRKLYVLVNDKSPQHIQTLTNIIKGTRAAEKMVPDQLAREHDWGYER